uniref:Uncharacterized protein n=1 Tax=Panagrolaimus davidi TaxID=227884 RepID=A0A914QNV6_9BILA
MNTKRYFFKFYCTILERTYLTALKGKKIAGELVQLTDQVVVKVAVVELAGAEQNIVNISKKEFEDLLMVNRQELGRFSPIFPNITERDKMIAVGPLLLDLCRAGKYEPFVNKLFN